MAKLKLDDVLAEEKEEVQTFKKAEKKAKLVKKAEANKKEVGRPAKAEDEKAKKRCLYYTDDEWEQVVRIADLYDMKPAKWIKMIIRKEIKKGEY